MLNTLVLYYYLLDYNTKVETNTSNRVIAGILF